MALYGYRLVGAALLDRGMYEGIEADRGALSQAMATVVLSSLAAGIGASGWQGPRPAALVAIAVIALVTWVAWAVLMNQIGGRLLPTSETRTSTIELMRTIGFAASPGLLQVLGVFPRVTVFVFVVSWLWMFAATVVAVRQALDYTSTARALLVCALALLICVVVAVVLSASLGPVLAPDGTALP